MNPNSLLSQVDSILASHDLRNKGTEPTAPKALQVVGKREPGPLYSLKDALIKECETNGYNAERLGQILDDWKQGYVLPDKEGQRISNAERASLLAGKSAEEIPSVLQKIEEMENPAAAWQNRMNEEQIEAFNTVLPYKDELESQYGELMEKYTQIRELASQIKEQANEIGERLGKKQEVRRPTEMSRTPYVDVGSRKETPRENRRETPRPTPSRTRPQNQNKGRGKRRSDSPLRGEALEAAEDFIIAKLLDGYVTVDDIREEGTDMGLGDADQIGDAFFDLTEKIKDNKGITLLDEEGNERQYFYKFYRGNKNVALIETKASAKRFSND